MKLKNMWKRFWTLDVHNHEGFTLVELIIVIAILAILSTGAIAGYSAYVERANMAADKALVAEVANALLLAYYNDSANAAGSYVILAPNGAEASGDFASNAMTATYGESWPSLKLKYDGWKSNSTDVGQYFTGSSFEGKEEDLLKLTDEMSGMLKDYLINSNDYGSAFGNYLTANGIDKGTVGAGNAAVVYVAEAIQKANKENIVKILSRISYNYASDLFADQNAQPDQHVINAVAELAGEVNGSTMVTAAILYAYAEAYCQYSGKTIELDFEKITSGSAGVNEVKSAFINVMKVDVSNPDETQKGMEYSGLVIGGTEQDPSARAIQDARAVLATLSAIDNAKDTFMGDIHKEGVYSSKQGFIESYLAAAAQVGVGEILIMIDENGNVLIDPFI